jgi:hypothetical protein
VTTAPTSSASAKPGSAPFASVDSAADFFTQAAKQSSEQFAKAVRQGAKFSIDATSAWFDTVAKFVPAAPALPFVPSEEIVKVWTDAGFDAAQNLLDLQREITGEVIAKFAALSA